MRGDFHTHSTLDDGKSSLEEMAAAARAAGLTHFGFSGHSYCPLEEDYCIHREKIPEYLARARALQVQYAGEMEVFVGLELDLLGERPEGLDYAIGSVHSICGGDGRYFAVDESPETARKCVEENPFFDDDDWVEPRHPLAPERYSQEVRGGALRRGLGPLYRRILRPGGPPAGADGMRLDRAL